MFVLHYGSGENLYTGCFPPIRSRVGTRPPNCDHRFSTLDSHHTGQDEHRTDTGHGRGVRESVGGSRGWSVGRTGARGPMKGGKLTGPPCSFLGHLMGRGVTLTLSGLCRPFSPPVAPSASGWRCFGRARRAEHREDGMQGLRTEAERGTRRRRPRGLAQEGQSRLPRADAPGTKEGGLPLLRLT